MAVRSSVLLLASLPAIAQAQTALPSDIHPVTLSRLPPVAPDDLDEEGRRLPSGRPAAVQLMMIMGDYFRVGFMMNAVDQHLPPERKALLPPVSR